MCILFKFLLKEMWQILWLYLYNTAFFSQGDWWSVLAIYFLFFLQLDIILKHLGKENLNWENTYRILACRSMCSVFLVTDRCGSLSQPVGPAPITELVVFGSMWKQAKKARESNNPPKPLYQLPPPSSCSIWSLASAFHNMRTKYM